MTAALHVLAAAVWTPDSPSLEALLGQRRQPRAARPETQLLTARARGRASLLTLMFAHVVEEASRAANVDRARVPTIFGSAYGEMTTTIALLELLHSAEGRLSPAKFQASVHNTAAGQISIAQANRSFSISLAAGHGTLAMALVEAWAWLASRPGDVLVSCADEAAPIALDPGQNYDPLALALVLSNVPQYRPVLARLERLEQTTLPCDAASSRENPCVAALPLVRAIHAAGSSTVVLNRAEPQTWQIDVHPTFQGP